MTDKFQRIWLITVTLIKAVYFYFFHRRDFKSLIADEIFTATNRLGGIYIKFLQILVVNANFLSNLLTPEKLGVFEQVTEEPLDVKAVLEKDLSKKQLARLSQIETRPFASGSFAQVYKAKLDEKQDIVIKVLRPKQTRLLTFDLKILGLVANLISLVGKNNGVNLNELFHDYKRLVLSEINYKKELKNQLWFYNYFHHHPWIKVPKVYADLSTRQFLIQDYIGGISLAELMIGAKDNHSCIDPRLRVRRELGSDLYAQLQRLGVELVVTSLLADFTPGDPHPGNIKVLPNNQIALIDFGLVVRSCSNKQTYLGFIKQLGALYNDNFQVDNFAWAILDFFATDLAESLRVTNRFFGKKLDLIEKFNAYLKQDFISNQNNLYIQELIKQRKVLPLFATVINRDNQFGVQVGAKDLPTMKAALTYLKVMREFYDEETYNQRMKNVLAEVLAKAESAKIESTFTKKLPSLAMALETLDSWLGRLAEAGNPFYYQIALGR